MDTTYSVESQPIWRLRTTNFMAMACTWENDPNSPNYRSCLSTGKAGGDITVTYKVKIISVPASPLVNPEPLSTLIYDFSGSSYHYNADYGVSTRYAQIIDPTTLYLDKNFSPDPIGVNGVSALTFTITNPYNATINGINFIDTFPTSPGDMTVASPLTTSNTCGGTLYASDGTTALAAGATSIRLGSSTGTNTGSLPPNGTCSITVNVTVD